MAQMKELNEALDFGLSLGMALDVALENGFQFLPDMLALVPSMTKLPAAVSGADQIPNEIENMTEEGRKELVDKIAELDLKSEFSEEIIEQSLVLAAQIGKLVQTIRKAKK